MPLFLFIFLSWWDKWTADDEWDKIFESNWIGSVKMVEYAHYDETTQKFVENTDSEVRKRFVSLLKKHIPAKYLPWNAPRGETLNWPGREDNFSISIHIRNTHIVQKKPNNSVTLAESVELNKALFKVIYEYYRDK